MSAWLLIALLFFVLGGSLHFSFLARLSQRGDRATDMGCILDGGLAMLGWAMGSLSLVRGICALLAESAP